MNVEIMKDAAVFTSENSLAGTYVLNDRFKPHFNQLFTPAGHNCVVVSPGDHRHHKGLMYALKTEEVNFWEEDAGSGFCGVQEILRTEVIDNGIEQQLLWREEQGNFKTYEEKRTITCIKKENTYQWKWVSERNALRDHRLIKSHWTLDLEDGRKINYHGLGIRFPWMWCFGGDNFGCIELNGQKSQAEDVVGTTERSVGFSGLIDGHWNRTVAAVTIKQEQKDGWFALRDGFPYLSVGPSVLNEVSVTKGQTFSEAYNIVVEDRYGI